MTQSFSKHKDKCKIANIGKSIHTYIAQRA